MDGRAAAAAAGRCDVATPAAGAADRRPTRRRHRGGAAPSRRRVATAVAGDDRRRRRPAHGARRRRSADPLLVRRSRLADRQLPDRVRRSAGERRDAERGPAVHGRPHHSVDPPRHRDRHDHAAHRRVVARGSRVAVCRALRRPARDRGRGQRHPDGRRSRDRRRHHRRAGARVGGRRQRHRASGGRLDRRRDHPGDGRAGRRRPGVGLARTGRHPPGDAGGGRRARRARSVPTGRRGMPVTCGTSSATAICCFPTLAIDDVDDGDLERRRAGRRPAACRCRHHCPPDVGRSCTPCAGSATPPPTTSPRRST